MSYGFVFAYILVLLLRFIFPYSSSGTSSLNVFFVLLGSAGGLFPDIDRLEQFGFSHRKTLHYIIGYVLLAIILIVLGYSLLHNFLTWIIGLSCFFAGAWLHSLMDIFDGFWAEDINKGVYEHLTRRWLKALNWIPFATLWEWSLQSFSMIFVIAISPQLGSLFAIQGWLIATISYFAIWLFSTCYEFYRSVPIRWEMEERALLKVGLEPKYRRRMAIR
ncbi:hypothetical protein KEJ51_04595 [Candidatus Bathyarchaeota archaeon]|nr:hypothetical protein [Candidatus Bathyarchaeota archaeon]